MVTKDHLFNAPIRSWMPIAVYKAYLPNMPDVVMGKVPALMSGAPGLRWKTWICETREERENVLKQLDKPCPVTQGALDFRRGPDSAVARKASGMALRPDAGIRYSLVDLEKVAICYLKFKVDRSTIGALAPIPRPVSGVRARSG